MTGTQFTLAVLGGVIGCIIGRLTYTAIRRAIARKHPPGGDLPITLTRVNQRRLLVLLTDAANVGCADLWRLAGGSADVWFGFLDRLEDAGLVTGEWESPEPLDHPRRRFYRLTPDGRVAAMQALKLKEGARQ